MTTYYVDSNASGANDGTSWTDAWTAVESATGLIAGDVLYLEYRHVEGATVAFNVDFATGESIINPIKIISVDKDNSDAYRRGATIDTTAAGFSYMRNPGHYYGIDYTTGGSGRVFFSTGLSSMHVYHYDCIYDCAELGCYSDSNNEFVWENCTFDNLHFVWHRYSSFKQTFKNCIFNERPSNTSAGLIYLSGVDGALYTFIDCHINPDATTAWTQPVSHDGTGLNTVRFIRCNMPNWTYAGPASANLRVEYINCESGTISAPPLMRAIERRGEVDTSLAEYRTGGADDGEQANPYSWEMASDATETKEALLALESPEIVRWVDSGSQTLTIYVASGATLNDDDFWIEVSSPNETANPNQTAQGKFNTTRMAPQATPAALTTDSGSTWNGSGVGTKQKIDVSITPTEPGPVTVRCFLAKASTTVYVDPKIEVS